MSANANTHPLVKDAQIREALVDRQHWLNRDARFKATCISNMTGLNKDLGVHLNVVPPGTEATEMHHHYVDSEWLYVLKGSGKLLLAPCEMGEGGSVEWMGDTSGMAMKPHTAPVEEYEIGPGDFMGFPGGPGGTASDAVGPNGTPWAHSLVAGPEGIEYLVGGTRKGFDVCIYPQKGKVLLMGKQARCEADAKDFRELNVKMEPK